ncbi:MAG: hypothetical protein KF832_22265 [Caldilineaceae bacterium]|nr:hypothetical protein [Caldilineaceae bacterium]
MLTTLLAQIAPQRSTQYATLARTLALPELLLSPLGPQISASELVTLGGQEFLRCDLAAEPTPAQRYALGMLAMTSAFFTYYAHIGEVAGPLLRPIETAFQPALPPDLVATRRYRGKTNELFTHFLCNLARFSSDFPDQPWSELHLLDPLMGGGTTLFTGLMLGAGQVAGIEQDTEDVRSTATFLHQYLQQERVSHKMQPERLKRLGLRWSFTIGKKESRTCLMANGDTLEAPALLPGFKPHLIVADLPYGIQHQGQLLSLLTTAVPIWVTMLRRGGALVLAWDATRFARSTMIEQLQGLIDLTILDAPPYDQLVHSVDRVIKARDVIVARR